MRIGAELLDRGGLSGEVIELIHVLQKEKDSFGEMGIDLEEKSFYDILKSLAYKYDFVYPEGKLIKLAKEVKTVVDDKARYTDWSQRDDLRLVNEEAWSTATLNSPWQTALTVPDLAMQFFPLATPAAFLDDRAKPALQRHPFSEPHCDQLQLCSPRAQAKSSGHKRGDDSRTATTRFARSHLLQDLNPE